MTQTSIFHQDDTPVLTKTASSLKKMPLLTFLLSATAALHLSLSPAFADAPVDDPFMWMDSGEPAPMPERPQAVPEKYEPPAPAPMAAPMPQAPVAQNGSCFYPDGRPVTLDFPYGPMLQNHPGYTGHAYDARRGYMAGDDGVLRGIQDNPCVDIFRRGGETPESAAGWLHPHDIRRVNTLEDRRIPVHQIGRYDPNGENLWYTNPDQPFSDPEQSWDVREGELLSQMMRRWGAEAGWTVVFQSQADFILQANVTIRGSFPDAAGEVIASFRNANPPITADFYTGNKVVVVRSAQEFDSN